MTFASVEPLARRAAVALIRRSRCACRGRSPLARGTDASRPLRRRSSLCSGSSRSGAVASWKRADRLLASFVITARVRRTPAARPESQRVEERAISPGCQRRACRRPVVHQHRVLDGPAISPSRTEVGTRPRLRLGQPLAPRRCGSRLTYIHRRRCGRPRPRARRPRRPPLEHVRGDAARAAEARLARRRFMTIPRLARRDDRARPGEPAPPSPRWADVAAVDGRRTTCPGGRARARRQAGRSRSSRPAARPVGPASNPSRRRVTSKRDPRGLPRVSASHVSGFPLRPRPRPDQTALPATSPRSRRGRAGNVVLREPARRTPAPVRLAHDSRRVVPSHAHVRWRAPSPQRA